ncbi:MAG TPA: FAD-dependent oxidoreductase, partial [Bryobacteraceae bacterium]|nr:FAD-dependent oxidoreductase [Bryobacteraceae bacterium]
MRPVVVIGGGLSGLSTAYYLSKGGVPVVLCEKSQRLGGILHTDHIDGFIIENGADSWIYNKPWARDLAIELGLGDQLIGC